MGKSLEAFCGVERRAAKGQESSAERQKGRFLTKLQLFIDMSVECGSGSDTNGIPQKKNHVLPAAGVGVLLSAAGVGVLLSARLRCVHIPLPICRLPAGKEAAG
jgi:hypothetical protein